MKKTLFLLLSVILIISFSCTKQKEDLSSIIFYIGDVKKNDKDIEIGDILQQNDVIVTGEQSSCDIKLGGSILRIKEKSRMILSELTKEGGNEKTTIGLDVGKVLCKAKKLTKDERFLVKTPTAVAGVRGTKFTVESDPMKTSRVKVFQGEVKVVKRIKQFEEKIDTMMENAPSVTTEEKVVITEQEVKKTEEVVEKAIEQEQAATGKPIDEVAMVKVIEQVQQQVAIPQADIQKFKVEDFKDDKEEVIQIEEKPKDVIEDIKEVVKIEKKAPLPEGRILITRHMIYFIKDGKVAWEGKVINAPVTKDNKIYIASKDFVYCAAADGPVIWRKKVDNDGKLELRGDKVLIYTKNKAQELDIIDGSM